MVFFEFTSCIDVFLSIVRNKGIDLPHIDSIVNISKINLPYVSSVLRDKMGKL